MVPMAASRCPSFNPLFAGLTLKVSRYWIGRIEYYTFQSPICGADAQSSERIAAQHGVASFNPLFAGLTLKGGGLMQMDPMIDGFQSPICGADAQSPAMLRLGVVVHGFNPLFAGLTLKAGGWPGIDRKCVVSIPYLRG